MKLERIDENSIRCILTSLDLSSRNLNLKDMAYGSAAAKKLFREMMQKAYEELGFAPYNTPIMIEAVPMQGGAIQLIITKVEDPEELDTRFSRFSRESMQQNGWISQLASEILEGAQELIKQIKDKDEQPGEAEKPEAKAEKPDTVWIYRFRSLDRVSSAAAAAGGSYTGVNTLYKDTSAGGYYLVLRKGEEGDDAFARMVNLLAEYGTKVNGELLNEAYYNEHYDVLIRGDALQKLAKL